MSDCPTQVAPSLYAPRSSRAGAAPAVITVLALCALSLPTRPAQAVQFMDLTSVSAPGPFCAFGCTFGYDFTLATSSTIAAIGIWDHDADGLNSSHEVGLWDNLQNLVLTTTITNSSIPVNNGFGQPGRWLFNNITPMSLAAGDYYIAMLQPGTGEDDYVSGGESINIAGASIGSSRFGGYQSSTLTFPNTVNDSNGAFGPNWSTTAVVPEPGTAMLLAVGLTGLAASRRR